MQLAARKAVEHRTWSYINSQLMQHYADAIRGETKHRELVA
jgi:phosphatidylinositol alpha 1,6-mannosyltransferase